MSECVIIDVTNVAAWGFHQGGGAVLPERQRPTVLQASRPEAQREAMRLALAHPGHRFAIFEAVAAGLTIDMLTQIDLRGEVRVQVAKATVVPLHSPDDLPF